MILPKVVQSSDMVRLKDVAYEAGYDISTVSKVLQGGNIHVSKEARDRITKAAEKLGYRPNLMARGLRTRKAGAIVLGLPRLDRMIFPLVSAGAEQAARELGLVLFVFKYPETGADEVLLDLVRQGRADGIILSGDIPDVDFHAKANCDGVPVVTLNRSESSLDTSVVLDDEAGFAAQASYLADLGHRNIVLIGGRQRDRTTEVCEDAFRSALNCRGIVLEPDQIIRAEFDGSDIEQTAAQVLSLNPRPTAVATANLMMAVRLIRALSCSGVRVPEEISVIGYHDSALAELVTPAVTTVRMPSCEQGQLGVQRLFELMQNPDQPLGETVCSSGFVVERDSCRRIETTQELP